MTIENRPQAVGSRGKHLAVTVSAVGPNANRVCYNFGTAPQTNGDGHYFAAWVRSADGTNFKARLELSATIHAFNFSCTYDCGYTGPAVTSEEFTATSVWQKITVAWYPARTYPNTIAYTGTFEAHIVPSVPAKTVLIDEATETGTLVNDPCPPGGSVPECAGLTGGGVVTPPGAHFLTNGVPTILELSDNLDCVVLDASGRAILSSDKTNCLVVTPVATGAGYQLAVGAIDFPGISPTNLTGICMLRDGLVGMRSGPCDSRSEMLITDVPGSNAITLQFPVRGVGVDSPCLARQPSSMAIGFYPCGASGFSNSQLWFDGPKSAKVYRNGYGYTYGGSGCFDWLGERLPYITGCIGPEKKAAAIFRWWLRVVGDSKDTQTELGLFNDAEYARAVSANGRNCWNASVSTCRVDVAEPFGQLSPFLGTAPRVGFYEVKNWAAVTPQQRLEPYPLPKAQVDDYISFFRTIGMPAERGQQKFWATFNNITIGSPDLPFAVYIAWGKGDGVVWVRQVDPTKYQSAPIPETAKRAITRAFQKRDLGYYFVNNRELLAPKDYPRPYQTFDQELTASLAPAIVFGGALTLGWTYLIPASSIATTSAPLLAAEAGAVYNLAELSNDMFALAG